ncbi:MAG: DNA repair protein RecO [Gemmatimonadetes bacterium]|nr:DNA repair protein RecO [Gemmatimonadota bacterium]MDA1104734.1 DNA repair protein RecO [Gemmatimonadota bacterium]
MAPVCTPAVLLRGHDYGDSSRILKFLTRDHGLVSVMARGVRGRSGKGTTTVASFASGELTAFVKSHRDLHTMKDFHCTRLREGLARDVLRFAGASAAAELVLAHAEQEPPSGLFEAVEQALNGLEEAPREDLAGRVLAGLWTITEAFGFAPQLEPCVRCDEPLGPDEIGRFDFAAGGIRCLRCGEDAAGPRVGPVARAQLAMLLAGEVPTGLSHARQHLGLVSDFVAYHVVAKPLKSLRFLGDVLPLDPEVEVA